MEQSSRSVVEQPAALVVRRVVRPGKSQEFEDWVRGITHEAQKFTGHLGADIIRPGYGARPEYLIIFHFDRHENLKAWEDSDLRRQWLERVRPLIDSDTTDHLTGLEYWFTGPDGTMPTTPKRYKQTLVTWLAITPLSYGFSVALAPVLGGLPLPLRVMITTALLTLMMSYIVMPRLTRLFARWLFRDAA
jgi:hypothetical protein